MGRIMIRVRAIPKTRPRISHIMCFRITFGLWGQEDKSDRTQHVRKEFIKLKELGHYFFSKLHVCSRVGCLKIFKICQVILIFTLETLSAVFSTWVDHFVAANSLLIYHCQRKAQCLTQPGMLVNKDKNPVGCKKVFTFSLSLFLSFVFLSCHSSRLSGEHSGRSEGAAQ